MRVAQALSKLATVFGVSAVLVTASPANAYFQKDLLKGKKFSGQPTQWTLADWLDEKNKISLLDHWLALHSSSDVFQIDVGATAQSYSVKTLKGTTQASRTQTAQGYHTDIYISILNLNGEYEKTNDHQESFGGALGLRLLGSNSQTTSLTARYGWRRLANLTTQERWDNQYLEGALQLYVISSAGLSGQYRYYFPAKSGDGNELRGFKVTAGIFFELAIFRVYGNFFQEPLRLSKDGVVTEEVSSGLEGGVKLFF